MPTGDATQQQTGPCLRLAVLQHENLVGANLDARPAADAGLLINARDPKFVEAVAPLTFLLGTLSRFRRCSAT